MDGASEGSAMGDWAIAGLLWGLNACLLGFLLLG